MQTNPYPKYQYVWWTSLFKEKSTKKHVGLKINMFERPLLSYQQKLPKMPLKTRKGIFIAKTAITFDYFYLFKTLS